MRLERWHGHWHGIAIAAIAEHGWVRDDVGPAHSLTCGVATTAGIRRGIQIFKTGVSSGPAQAGSIPVRLRDAAEQAWRRAAEVVINRTRKELGVSDQALRTAWQRHGLGLPPHPTSDARTAVRRLDAAFLALNRKLLPGRARSEQELAARVRRAEEYAIFGAEVVVELGSETYGKRPAARAWAITRRAQRAHRRASARQQRDQRRQADRASRADRTSRARAPGQQRELTADAR
jgi:hypothetical protein